VPVRKFFISMYIRMISRKTFAEMPITYFSMSLLTIKSQATACSRYISVHFQTPYRQIYNTTSLSVVLLPSIYLQKVILLQWYL